MRPKQEVRFGKKPKTWNFTDDLAEYVNASFRKEDMTDFRQHIMFRGLLSATAVNDIRDCVLFLLLPKQLQHFLPSQASPRIRGIRGTYSLCLATLADKANRLLLCY